MVNDDRSSSVLPSFSHFFVKKVFITVVVFHSSFGDDRVSVSVTNDINSS